MDSDSWNLELCEREDLSSICSSLSSVYRQQGESQKAMDFAWKAIDIFKGNEQAAWLIREIEGILSINSKYFRLMIEGVWNTPFDGYQQCPGFFISYDVVAEDQEEAVFFIKRFEPVGVRNRIAIQDVDTLKPSPELPKGVYFTSGYCFFNFEK